MTPGAAARVGIADADDPRVVEAVGRLLAAGNVVPVVFGGDPTAYPGGVEHVAVPPGADAVTVLARTLASSDLVAGIAGSLSTSAAVIRAGIRNLCPAGLVSGCFALRHPGGWVTYADCAVVPEPTTQQLADIAWAAARHHEQLFGEQPRVAMLSFSTLGSADHERARRVREAASLLASRHPELLVEGEMQFDVAVDPEVARLKLPGSAVAGRANVMVFPSLEAGNIAYKVAERIGGARALGSFLLGLAQPWVDLSRGCSSNDIVETVELLVTGAGRPARLERTVA